MAKRVKLEFIARLTTEDGQEREKMVSTDIPSPDEVDINSIKSVLDLSLGGYHQWVRAVKQRRVLHPLRSMERELLLMDLYLLLQQEYGCRYAHACAHTHTDEPCLQQENKHMYCLLVPGLVN